MEKTKTISKHHLRDIAVDKMIKKGVAKSKAREIAHKGINRDLVITTRPPSRKITVEWR